MLCEWLRKRTRLTLGSFFSHRAPALNMERGPGSEIEQVFAESLRRRFERSPFYNLSAARHSRKPSRGEKSSTPTSSPVINKRKIDLMASGLARHAWKAVPLLTVTKNQYREAKW